VAVLIATVAILSIGLHPLPAAQERGSNLAAHDIIPRLEDQFDRLLDADIPLSMKRDAAEVLSAYGQLLPATPQLERLFNKAKQDGILPPTPWQDLGPGRSSAESQPDMESARAHAVEAFQEDLAQQSPAFKRAAFQCREDLRICRVRNYGWLDCELLMITCLFGTLLD
jgi:hypothetical protein